MQVDASSAIKGLKDLETKVAKSYVRKSLRAAAKVTLAVAKSTAPEQTGELKRSIKIRSGGTRKGVVKLKVGIGKKWYSGPVFYGAFVAFGHKVGSRKLGDTRKQVPPNEFLTKAYEQTKSQAVEVFNTTISELIQSHTT